MKTLTAQELEPPEAAAVPAVMGQVVATCEASATKTHWMVEAPCRRRELTRGLVGICTALLLAVALAAFLTGHVGRALDDLGELAAALLASISCASASRSSHGRLRAGWAGLAAACFSWTVGEAIWSTYELALRTTTPFPSVADVGFLGFPVGAMVALALFPSGSSWADRRRMTLDGLTVACAIGLVSWGTALGAVVHASGGSPLAIVVSTSYPMSDIALLVVCVLVMSRSRSHQVPLAFVAAGLSMMAVSDSGFAFLTAKGTYTTGNPIDLGWFLAFGLLALAPLAWDATDKDVRVETPAVAGALLPYVPLAGAFAFIGWRYDNGHHPSTVEMGLAAALTFLVLLRQFLTLHDNQRLALVLAGREAELRHQAFHDGLTGLANRALYVDRVAHALELHRRDRRPLAICFLDLDGFKAVNDTHGHAAGDDLLKQVSGRFRGVLSEADTLARLGGDEFAVLLEDHPAGVDVARSLLASLSKPFHLRGHEVTVLASVGVATVDLVDNTPTLDELLTRADVAMYVVKRRGKADVLLHAAGMQLEELDEVTLGRALASALEEQQVSVLFQPIVELASGRVHTVEALARWAQHGRPISPEVFVPVAERCNLIDGLFRLVLTRTCEQLVRWSALPGGSRLQAAVNLSPQQLSSPELVPFVVHTLEQHGLTGDRLVLEITETTGLADTDLSSATCHDLRRLGVRLSLDDLGNGLSTLARLRDLPIDEVKIDRSFVVGVDEDGASRRFVRGVLALAAEIGLAVVAEGVEREAEGGALADLGCHRAQGYLFSRPVPADAIDALIDPMDRSAWRVPSPREGRAPQRSGRARATLPVADDTFRTVLSMHESGASMHTIAAKLNTDGIPTPSGARWHARSIARVVSDARDHDSVQPPAVPSISLESLTSGQRTAVES